MERSIYALRRKLFLKGFYGYLSFLFFERAIPYKRQKFREIRNNRWLSKGLINLSKSMKILNNLKRRFTLMREDLEYIKNVKKCIRKF